MDTNQIDQSKADAFADRMLNILNEGALALMSSIGQRTRLFDVMSGLPPSTGWRGPFQKACLAVTIFPEKQSLQVRWPPKNRA